MRGVAFDFNGVLVDDEPLHGEALSRAFAPYGITISRELYWERYLAYDDRGAIAKVIEDHPGRVDARESEAIMKQKIAHYMELLGTDPPFFPGAIEAVKAFADRWPLVVVSGARRQEIEATLAHGGIAPLFRGIVASEDCAVSKPDPEPYIRGAAILGIPANSLLAIEDSIGGLRSAKAAGCLTAAVAHTYSAAELGPLAETVVNGISDLTPEQFGA